MAAVAEIAGEQTAANTTTTTPTTANTTTTNNNENNEKNNNKLESMKSDSQFDVQKLVDMFTKLNPLAKEFFPSYYHQNGDDQNENFANNNKHSANDSFPRRVLYPSCSFQAIVVKFVSFYFFCLVLTIFFMGLA